MAAKNHKKSNKVNLMKQELLSKPLQIKAVAHLFKQKNTFVMAGTSFGKSHILKMYLGGSLLSSNFCLFCIDDPN
ncbi:uncharacterized protein VP01_242g2 [Puccinia sorghi]|uniref:Uncharacterized protein n=1 Tax=Puccinia sorghi TaxID=27349 RepID=A0A0L6V752_9BASI|nr:uncharacterized protein VP01_242g2 [Puccinia sorghi]